ncbi:MAG: hypothetical protein INH34_01940 [Phycisphaerales bacterium]|nr:hypothetical protein [Phycisphaerales bacterium]
MNAPRRLRSVASAMAALAAACAAPPAAAYEPAPLRGAALQLVRDIVAASPGEPRPGDATVADGTRVPYDRFCLVGSEFANDRTRSYFAFVDDLRRLRGDFATLEEDASGRPTKVLVEADGKRVAITYLRW